MLNDEPQQNIVFWKRWTVLYFLDVFLLFFSPPLLSIASRSVQNDCKEKLSQNRITSQLIKTEFESC